MKYIIVRKNGVAVEKHAIEGSQESVDAFIQKIAAANNGAVVSEESKESASEIVVSPQVSREGKEWDDFKKTKPSVAELISFIAKKVGLE